MLVRLYYLVRPLPLLGIASCCLTALGSLTPTLADAGEVTAASELIVSAAEAEAVAAGATPLTAEVLPASAEAWAGVEGTLVRQGGRTLVRQGLARTVLMRFAGPAGVAYGGYELVSWLGPKFSEELRHQRIMSAMDRDEGPGGQGFGLNPPAIAPGTTPPTGATTPGANERGGTVLDPNPLRSQGPVRAPAGTVFDEPIGDQLNGEITWMATEGDDDPAKLAERYRSTLDALYELPPEQRAGVVESLLRNPELGITTVRELITAAYHRAALGDGDTNRWGEVSDALEAQAEDLSLQLGTDPNTVAQELGLGSDLSIPEDPEELARQLLGGDVEGVSTGLDDDGLSALFVQAQSNPAVMERLRAAHSVLKDWRVHTQEEIDGLRELDPDSPARKIALRVLRQRALDLEDLLIGTASLVEDWPTDLHDQIYGIFELVRPLQDPIANEHIRDSLTLGQLPAGKMTAFINAARTTVTRIRDGSSGYPLAIELLDDVIADFNRFSDEAGLE